MDVTFSELVVWLVVGMLAGSLTGLVVKRRKERFAVGTHRGIPRRQSWQGHRVEISQSSVTLK